MSKPCLSAAYSVSRKKQPKKMADGGILDTVVKSFTEDPYDSAVKSPDAKKRELDPERTKAFVKGFEGNDNKYAEGGTVKKINTMPLKRPRFVESSVVRAKLRDQEDDLMSSMPPDGYKNQPSKIYDEVDASKKGPDVSDMEREHNNGRKPYAKGGSVDMQPEDDSIEMRERDEEAHLMSELDPSEDEGDMDARSRNEMDPDRSGPSTPSLKMKMMASGGSVEHEMDMQPMDEEEEEHHDSIAAAVMAKRRKYAEGGAIKSHDSIYSDDSDQADLSRNADEDANEEDQLSFNALRKENYSESEGLDDLDQPMDSNEHGHDIEEDKHDMVAKIRSKMKSKKQF